MSKTRIRLTPAELYEKVWATPMRTLAQGFGMSDVALAKVCRKHNIPVPPVGYWRRKETGHKVKLPALPPAKDDSEHLDICIRVGTFCQHLKAVSFIDTAVAQRCAALHVPNLARIWTLSLRPLRLFTV